MLRVYQRAAAWLITLPEYLSITAADFWATAIVLANW